MNNREVMQQALEAIRIFREWETGQDYESCRATVLARALAAEESLGAALAEPQDEEIEALKNELAFWEKYVDHIHDKISAAQRQPLPKHDQHCVDVPGYGLMATKLVRAVERAHGIGG